MKKIILGIVFLLLPLIQAPKAEAKVIMQEGGTATVKAEEVIEDDLWIFADNIDIQGTVSGDVYAFGQSINHSGIITGDFVAGGSDVRVSGEVDDDLWVGAGTVYITGADIEDGVNIGAGNVLIDEATRINGSLMVGAGKLDNNAAIGRNLMAGVGNFKLNAPVGGEVRLGAGTIEMGSKAQIKGDLIYASDSNLVISDGASIGGETNKIETPQADQEKMREDFRQFGKVARTGFNLLSFFGALIVGVVLIWLLPKTSTKISNLVESQFLASLGWGLLMVVLAGPALALLAITGIGAPLSFILGLALIVDFYLAKVWVSMALGKLIQEQFKWKGIKSWLVYALGLFVYYVARVVPVLGGFVRLTVFLSGVGAMWLYLRGQKGK